MIKTTKYVIKDGDNLTSIAQTVLGDANESINIAIVNELDYPFIGRLGEDTKPGIKYPGDTLIIPILESEDLVEENNYISDEDCDILLNANDFNLSTYSGGEFEVNNYGDLTTVTGDDSLHQDLIHRLETEEGTLLYHPGYGSKLLRLIGTKKDSTWMQRVTIEVLKTLRSDPRVKDVSDLKITSIPYGILIQCIIHTDYTQFSFNESLTKQEQEV